jgi:oligosaccharyltransferase complex subunit alpha (ribophorin I)
LIDLSKHIVRIQTDIQFVDQEKDSKKYQFALFEDQSKHLSYINVKCGKVECEIQPSKVKDAIQFYDVTFAENIPKGQAGIVKVTAYYTHVLVPFPEEITQQEDQLVVYEDSHLVLSSYQTTTQTTKLKLASNRVENFTPIEPLNRKGSSLSYGPFENVQPLDANAKSIRIHYKNHAPFMTITKLVKEIEVSMWGRVSVEEIYDLLHTGAKLKGGFSRFEYSSLLTKGCDECLLSRSNW